MGRSRAWHRALLLRGWSGVAQQFPGHASTTSWATESVDLPGVIEEQLNGLDVWFSEGCTHHDDGFFSHRLDASMGRLATLAWL